MAKTPSKHGLEKKYKPWRKGKSKNASKTPTLKVQLRSKKRQLLKITDEEIRSDIKKDIAKIELALKARDGNIREKKYAEKYRQIKFVERKKLLRMEKKAKKNLNEAKAAADFDEVEKYTKELEKTCIEQLYVAYFPNDTKYLALFVGGVRSVEDEKTTKKKAEIRQRIFRDIKSGKIDTSKSWVNMDILKGKDFNIEMTNSVGENNDSRFKDGGGANIMLSAMKEATTTTSALATKTSSHKTEHIHEKEQNTSSSDKYDEGDTKEFASCNIPGVPTVGDSDSSDSESDSSSSSSSNSSSSSDGSSDSDSVDELDQSTEDKKEVERNMNPVDNDEEVEESDDDFLVDATDNEISQVFKNAKKEKEDYSYKGDKSAGWKTQKQLPGEWKKRRQRH